MSANAWSHLVVFGMGVLIGFFLGLALMVSEAIRKIKIGP